MWKIFSEKKQGLVLRAANGDESKQAVFLAPWPWASHLTSLCSCLCSTNMDRITYLTKVLWGLKGCCQRLLIQILSVWMLVFNRIIPTPVIREMLPWFLSFFTLGNAVLWMNVKFSCALWFAKVPQFWSAHENVVRKLTNGERLMRD